MYFRSSGGEDSIRWEIKIRGAKGLGDPGATRGVIISQLVYRATTEAMILNEEAVAKGKVSTRAKSVAGGAYTGSRPNEES